MNIYLSFGSNIGDRRQNILKAVAALEENNIRKIKLSSFYETSPVGPKQRHFYNCAGMFKTDLTPEKLLDFIKKTEQKLGRTKTFRWGPRVIDVDILFYGKEVVKSKILSIPHSEIINRLFVLLPMNEISPGFVHPVLKKTIRKILKESCKTIDTVSRL
ncbi:MAG: 2-amino-4-hydroxy-6-hydroxymethyldihydropteridine diphosphokinase [Endomicrobiaceae bacterium]